MTEVTLFINHWRNDKVRTKTIENCGNIVVLTLFYFGLKFACLAGVF